MATLPIKVLQDEQKEPFIPFTQINGVYVDEQTTLQDLLNEKLEATDIKAGTNISVSTSGNEVTINATVPTPASLIDSLNTQTAGQGALDAHQGYVLKGMIPSVIDDVTSQSTTAALSANQGYLLKQSIDGKVSDKNFVFNQTDVASDTWVITHNLNKYPSVTVLDSSKNEVVGEVTYTNENQLTIKFSGAFKGSATLN